MIDFLSKQGVTTLINEMVAKCKASISSAINTFKGTIVDAAGKILADKLPIGSGLKVEDGLVKFDSSNVSIDADRINLDLKTINGESIKGTGDITIDLSLYKVVTVLPDVANADQNKIYLVQKADTPEGNTYVEYGVIDGKWEQLGEYKADVDLTPYVKSTDLVAMTETEIQAAVEAAWSAE